MGLWLRYYVETLNHPKIQSLEPVLFKTWVNLLCAAKEKEGILPEMETLSFQLRCPSEQLLSQIEQLKTKKLINERGGLLCIHNWDKRQYPSDNSTSRSRKSRSTPKTSPSNGDATLQQRPSNGDATLPERKNQKETEKRERAGEPLPAARLWILDSAFMEFHGLYTSKYENAIDEDFDDAFRYWKKFSLEEKLLCVSNLRARVAAKESFQKLPWFFAKSDWKREVAPKKAKSAPEYKPPPEWKAEWEKDLTPEQRKEYGL
jgi:hypothetical protein